MAAQVLHTVAELARLWRVSRNFLYREIAEGRLEAVRLGGRPAMTRIPEQIADQYWRTQLAPKKTVLRAVA